MKDIGIRETQVQPPWKTDMESHYTGPERISGLHDLQSCHHRLNGEHIQVPAGDISKVEEGEGLLGRPSPHLQNLMDRTVPLK